MSAVLLASLFGLALVDSINPSAIAMTVLLMAQPNFAVRGAVYIATIFVTYFALGVAILFGLDAAWGAIASRPGYIVQALLGAGLLGYAVFAPSPKADAPPPQIGVGLLAVVTLGVTITIAEFPTAIPYFAALALITDAQLTPVQWLPLLLAYNAIFVAPPLLLALTFLALGQRVQGRLDAMSGKLRAGAQSAVLWIMGIAGFLLLRHALAYLAIDFDMIDLPPAIEQILR